ncbi:hypothetical protein IQ24_01882 [Paracoccus sulfuroxidans]|uniref:Uncharacterized protein n=1 Tax=Paracoccus sulfuroxidans TaxID=384678 RepID=A0A562NQ89_9RHOB|nr:hypothetical protein IQ24_01882 [Paracoccus sulfuroxidans]
MIKTAILCLIIIVAIAIAGGPGFRRMMARLLGIGRNDRW